MNWIWVTAVIAFFVGMTMGMDGAAAYVVGLIMGDCLQTDDPATGKEAPDDPR